MTESEAQADVELLLLLGEKMAGERGSSGDETMTLILAKLLLRVRGRRGGTQPLIANKAQRELERKRGRRNIILKARQMGITTWVAARFFLKTITKRGVLTVLVAHTQEAAEAIFNVVQRFWGSLDKDMREGSLKLSISNVRVMRFERLDSEFRVLSAADRNAGRGLTMQNLHCSEVSRWPGNASETLAGLLAALSPEGELMIESTPNGAYGCFHEEWVKGIDAFTGGHSGSLVRHFFPWWLESDYRVATPATELRPDELELMRRHGLDACQIGHRRKLEAQFRQMRAQEFAEDPETCFRASGDCCFDVALIESRLAEVGSPIEIRREGALQVFLPMQPGKRYIVAVDTAGGGDRGDFAAVQVIEQQTGLQCAELQERLRPMELARVSAELAREYGEALVAVERNNHGGAVLAHLEQQDKYARIYRPDGEAGWLTTAASKPAMVGLMDALLIQSPWIFLSRRLLAECRTFVSSVNGKTGATHGSHDDCFMAMAVAQSVRHEVLAGRKVV